MLANTMINTLVLIHMELHKMYTLDVRLSKYCLTAMNVNKGFV